MNWLSKLFLILGVVIWSGCAELQTQLAASTEVLNETVCLPDGVSQESINWPPIDIEQVRIMDEANNIFPLFLVTVQNPDLVSKREIYQFGYVMNVLVGVDTDPSGPTRVRLNLRYMTPDGKLRTESGPNECKWAVYPADEKV
mgnify:FL=1